MILCEGPTRVANLNFRVLKNPSRVSHQAVVFGAALTKSSRTKSSISKSTARVGNDGAQGNKPRSSSCSATSWQVQILIISIPKNYSTHMNKDQDQ